MRHLGPPQLPNPTVQKRRKSITTRSRRVARKYIKLLDEAQKTLSPAEWQNARDWYSQARDNILREYESAWRTACGVMAATSPQSDVRDNWAHCEIAMDAWTRNDMGSWRPFLPCHEANVYRAIAGEPLSGQKVENFRLALLGEEAIVIDTWMLRAGGYCRASNNPSTDEIRVCYEATRLAALEAGLKVQEAQALIWTIYRNTNWMARRRVGTGALQEA